MSVDWSDLSRLSVHILPCTHRVDFDVKAGELVAVVGHVGAGKSSLIQALLGEMDKAQGQVSVKVGQQLTMCRVYMYVHVPTHLHSHRAKWLTSLNKPGSRMPQSRTTFCLGSIQMIVCMTTASVAVLWSLTLRSCQEGT